MNMLDYLTEKLIELVRIYVSELGRFISEEQLEFLSNTSNQERVIHFSDKGTGAWCVNCRRIYFGSNTASFIELLQRNPLYGTKPDNILITKENFVNSTLDYINYMEHFILAGKQEIDFYLDILPHEAMHLIGCSGGVIGEGVTEKRTREICLKHNLRCAPICHSKEVKLVSLMENWVGADTLTQAGFENNFFQYCSLEEALDNKCGYGTFGKVYTLTQPHYFKSYLATEYTNPFEKFKAYRALDFEPAYSILQTCK